MSPPTSSPLDPIARLPVEHDRSAHDGRGTYLAALADRLVAVVGYGNQGSAHALNLRDAGVRVVVGARSGSGGAARAEAAGFEVRLPAEAAAGAALVVVGAPDHVQPVLCRDELMPAMAEGATLGFMHGFALRFGGLVPRPDLGVVLVAPKGPGATLRQRFLEGRGIPCLLAVQQPGRRGDAETLALAWASGLGCGRAGIVRTTVAYVECVHELKQVVDLLFEHGISGMYARVSDTAEFGGRRAGGRIVDDAVKASMRALLAEIRDGRFARAIDEDHTRGFPWLNADREAGRSADIEDAGRTVRGWMPWLPDGRAC
jgi:ketol-acid reductoisomerase